MSVKKKQFKTQDKKFFFLGLLIVFIFIAFVFLLNNKTSKSEAIPEQAYAPSINPEDFTTEITNPYFSMSPGKRMVYESVTDEGAERVEIFIPGWTKEVMGVNTLVFWDRVYFNDQLIEDTRDYIAQDKEGNVWYFGEDVDNYQDGRIANHNGAWLAGVNGAMPGIWMMHEPSIGDEYRQEYYEGRAEDMGRVEGFVDSLTVPGGQFKDCVKILDWTQLESNTEYKYYCRGAGGLVLEEDGDEKLELTRSNLLPKNCIVPQEYSGQGILPC